MANPDSTVEVIEAIEAALRNDASMTALVAGRVFDRVPQQAVFPFVMIGDVLGQPALDTNEDDDDETEGGFDLSVSIEVWSKTRSRREVAQIMLAISERMRAGLALATKTLVLMELTDQRIPPTDDERPFGWQRWRILTDG